LRHGSGTHIPGLPLQTWPVGQGNCWLWQSRHMPVAGSHKSGAVQWPAGQRSRHIAMPFRITQSWVAGSQLAFAHRFGRQTQLVGGGLHWLPVEGSMQRRSAVHGNSEIWQSGWHEPLMHEYIGGQVAPLSITPSQSLSRPSQISGDGPVAPTQTKPHMLLPVEVQCLWPLRQVDGAVTCVTMHLP